MSILHPAFRATLFWWLIGTCCASAFAAGTPAGIAKPAQIDDASWASLQATVRKSIQQDARLVGGSVAGADGAEYDSFGFSVAVSGDTALVGAVYDDIGGTIDQGSVYVLQRAGSSWTIQTKLVASDGAENDLFGSTVALSGDTALIGAAGDDVGASNDQGSAYVFVRTGGTWTQQAKLLAGDGQPFDQFGSAVSIVGDTALVGAYFATVDGTFAQGAAYVFIRTGQTWSQQARLLAGDGAEGDLLGLSVALSGDTALVGAYGDDIGSNVDQGSAYVFIRAGSTWTQQAKMVADDGAASDRFGSSVALDGDTALLGALFHDTGGDANRGAAYVFARSGAVWVQQAKLVAGDGAADSRFGTRVSIEGDTALIGSPGQSVGVDGGEGAAYVFARSGTVWTQASRLSASAAGGGDAFGSAVALSGDTAMVGAEADYIGTLQGSASAFRRTGGVWAEEAYVSAGIGAAGSEFGYAVAVSGDTAVVGAPRKGVGNNWRQGVAAVFVKDGGLWHRQAILVAPDGAANDQFGWTVDVSGDTAIVGAPLDDVDGENDQGSAHVFTRNGTIWTYHSALDPADRDANDNFGFSVAIEGDTALVGSRRDETDGRWRQGSAYVFARSGAAWSLEAKLAAADAEARAEFGSSVALAGDTAVIGAPFDDVGGDEDRGSAYVFARNEAAWTQRAQWTADDGAAFDAFGHAVAVSGDIAVVGAVGADVGANVDQGAVYVYARTGTTWGQQARLVADDGAAEDRFGSTVAAAGAAVMVGAPARDVGPFQDQGAAYVFARAGTTWGQAARVDSPNGANNESFGAAVALSGTAAIVGAIGADGMPPFGNPDDGTAYVYSGVGVQATTTVISAAAPDPSMAGQTVQIDVATTGTGSPPIDGTVTVTASTGESCTDSTPASGAGNTALFRCGIAFPTVGPRTITATFGGSSVHSGSSSAADPHDVMTTLVVSPAQFADGIFATPYSQSVSATGAGSTPPFQYSIGSGALPSGLNLDGVSGLVSGTPGQVGTFTFEVVATDSSSAAVGGPFTGRRTYTMEIARAEQTTLSVSATPPTATLGGTSALATSGGSGSGAVTYTVTSGAAFCALSGNTLTGTGVGTCTVTATKAADATFNAATATVDVTVVRAEQAPLSAIASPASIPVGGSSTLATSGGSGSGAVTYTVTSGAAFCSLAGNTLTGTGVGTCTVTATKAADATFNAVSATTNVAVLAATDLEVSKSDGSQYALPNGLVEYVIVVANAGQIDAVGARLSDPVPPGLADLLWTCSALRVAACPAAAGTGGIDQAVDLPVGSALEYRVSARVTAALGATVTNTVTIATPTGTLETDASDNTASDINVVVVDGLFGDGFESQKTGDAVFLDGFEPFKRQSVTSGDGP